MAPPVIPIRFLPILSALLTLASPLPTLAETKRVALPEVIEFTLTHNPELKALRQETGIRSAAKTRAGLLPNPVLELEGATGALTGSSDDNTVSLGVSQEFLLNGKKDKRLRVAERELDLYQWQLADKERLLRGEAKAAFLDLLLAKERLALVDRFIELNRQLLEVGNERFAAGDIPELERNLVKVEVARSQAARIEAARELIKAEAKLATLMGLPPGDSPEVAEKLQPGPAVKLTVTDLKRQALSSRPDLKALQAEKAKGEAEVNLADAEAIPNLTAGLSVTRETSSMDFGPFEGRDKAWLIGVKLSMPIPLFDKNQAAVQEARARKSGSETRLSAAQGTVEREVESAYAAYLNADKILSIYESGLLPQFEENLNLTREAYRLGETGILSIIEQDKTFLEIHEGYLKALHDRQAALAELQTAVASELTGGGQ